MRRTPPTEQGAAFVLVITLLAALLAGGGVVLYLSSSQTKTSGELRRALDAAYCAEAGLVIQREIIAAVPDEWGQLLAGNPSPTIPTYPIEGDIDGDGENDYQVTIEDNDDDSPLDPETDTDGKIFIRSRCIKYDRTSREIIELISTSKITGHNYRDQAGQGSNQSGNAQ